MAALHLFSVWKCFSSFWSYYECLAVYAKEPKTNLKWFENVNGCLTSHLSPDRNVFRPYYECLDGSVCMRVRNFEHSNPEKLNLAPSSHMCFSLLWLSGWQCVCASPELSLACWRSLVASKPQRQNGKLSILAFFLHLIHLEQQQERCT